MTSDSGGAPSDRNRVLIVEDDELVASALAISLRRVGLEVVLTRNVDEALEAYDSDPPDVVVTDLIMPGASGLDLLRALDARDRNVPVIIVTGDPSLQPAAEAVREHAFDYLTKPVSREQLVSTVTRAIDSRRRVLARLDAEQRLQEEHRLLAIRHQRTAMLLSVLYNRAVEGILVLDTDGRLVDASDSFVALVGRPLHDLLDTDVRDLFDPHPTEGDVQTRVVSLIAGPLARGHWRGEVTVRAARGRRLPARMSLSVCETPSVDVNDSQTRYVIALLSHETSHEDLSRQLQQADRLATMGLLAGSAAHEIRNELGPLLGYLALLEQGGSLDSHDMIRVMRDSVKRVQEHVEQILSPLRPRVRTRGAVSFRDVIEGILVLLRRAGRLRRLRLQVVAPDDDVIVHADKNELHQIGLNLVTNALDALPDGGGGDRGGITIALSYDGDFGVLRVTDTGVGIPESVRARVFEPFFTTKGSGGTGLGLPVVLDIVRSLGGRVALDGGEAGGTAVTVWVPRYIASRVPDDAPR